MDDDLLAQGIAAVKVGNRQEARRLLDAATRETPNDERAWGWFYNVCENDGERIHCLRELLRINPNNETALKKLNEIINSDPLFISQTPNVTVNILPVLAPKKGEKKGLATWEKILLPVLIVIAMMAVCSLIFVIFKPEVNNAYEQIKADIYGTPTPTFRVLPIGSNLTYQNWSIHVDRIEILPWIDFAGVDYPKNGRYALLHLSVTNTGDSTAYFIPYIETSIMDGKTYYMCDYVLTSEEEVLLHVPPQDEIAPHQTVPLLGVYDISLKSDAYFLNVISANGGVLLDMP